MWTNYLKMAWRNLLRNRGYSLINILGLAIGLSCFMFIWLYIQDELSYDRWHEKGERIYRMALERKYPGRSRHYALIPEGYAAVAERDFPEVEESCRLFVFDGFGYVIRHENEVYKENEVMWSDTSFFELFDIPLLKGNPATALAKPFTVVLTQRAAKKYFGEEDPVGKTLELPEDPDSDGLEVTGVCADVPENTHLRFDMLVSSASLNFLADAEEPNFLNFTAYTYLLLRQEVSPAALEQKFPEMVTRYASGQVLNQLGVNYETYRQQGNGYRYFLQPLPDIYLDSRLEAEIKPPGSRQRVYFFSAIALLILAIGSINFMNLATARSANRAKEVGIRKTLGSGRRELMGLFLTEAVVIGLASGLIAYGINLATLDAFNQLTGKAISFSSLFAAPFLGMLLVATLITGLLSGLYPSFVLSAFRPMDVLRGQMMKKTSGLSLRNVLVTFQFAISAFLMICTIMVYRQLSFSQNKDLGFDKEQVISLQGGDNMTPQESETFKNSLRNLPGVTAVSGCSAQPGQAYFGLSFRLPQSEETVAGNGLIVDEGYIECMQMEIVEGRSFSEEFSDSLSIIINEAAAREMELEEPVGTRLLTPEDFLNPEEGAPSVYTIVGLVRDFHFQSLHHPIGPIYLINSERNFTPGIENLIIARLEGSGLPGTIQRIEGLWQAQQPAQPFIYNFLDQDWAELYDKEMMARRVFGLFSLLAIFVACLGLFALAAFTVEKRAKEIGIRKVLGASAVSILGLLSKDFLRLVVVALLVASPLAWYAMKQWLNSFAYRTALAWWVFVLSGAIAVLIAFLTVSFHSLKAARSNPVEALKDE